MVAAGAPWLLVEDTTVPETQSGPALSAGLVARLERRLDQSRQTGRDVDGLFKQLAAALGDAERPAEPRELLALATRASMVCSMWSVRLETPSRPVRVAAELALTGIYRGLSATGDEALDRLEPILDAWAAAAVLPRVVFTEVLLDASTEPVRTRLLELATARFRRARLYAAMPAPGVVGEPSAVAGARELALLVARLRSRAGDLGGALEALEDEAMTDERVALAYATVYREHGRLEEAIDRLQRCLVVAGDKRAVGEALVDAHVDAGQIEPAIQTLLRLLSDTSDVTYWEMLTSLALESDPARLTALRAELAEKLPALHVEVLIADGDVRQVADASRAKTFSYEQLWRIGDFLARNGDRTAARVYERAILLHGAVAQSKLQCAELGARLESVIPFFESIERPTKPARLAKELLAKNKNNIPMRREFERVFGAVV